MKRRSPGKVSTHAVAGEWIAGRRIAPFYVMEGGSYRPHILLWADAESGLILGMNAVPASLSPEETADALVGAIGPVPGYTSAPATTRADRRRGSRRRPADATRPGRHGTCRAHPRAGRGHARDGAVDGLRRHRARVHRDGGHDPGDGREVLRGGAPAGRVAPWRIARDAHVIRLDAPAFGVDRAVVSVIGALRQNLGFLVFDSAADYRSFLALSHAALETMSEGIGGPGVRLFSVNFEPAAKLPASMRKEAVRHGWAASARERWPWIVGSDADGVRRPVTAREFHLATACLQALTAFFARHAAIFVDASPAPVREMYTATDLPGSPVLTLTAPHPEVGWDVD